MQSLLFPKSTFNKTQVRSWIKKHKQYKLSSIDGTGNYWRVRQYNPESFSKMRTKALGSRGIKAVIGVVKK